MAHTATTEERNRSGKVLLLILFVALALRLCWFLVQTPNLGADGAEYAQVGNSLLKGNGYVGIYGGTSQMFPPLYPILIGTVTSMTGEAELAGRLISVMMGACLVIPVFFIALHIYERRIAFIAASLIALHPLLIKLSAEVLSEATYFTLMMGGVYWGLRSLDIQNSRHPVWSGICFGLAYLTRPEAILFPFLTVVALLTVAVTRRQRIREAGISSLRLVIPFVLLAAPYVTFLSLQTGHIRFEGKSYLNYAMGQRMNSGMDYMQAAYGIDENLNEEGPGLNVNLSALGSVSSRSLQEIVRYTARAASRNVKTLIHTLFDSRSFGSPILILLVSVGLFRTTWNQRRMIHEGFLVLMISAVFVALLSVQHFWARYAVPFVPFLTLWAAKGIGEISKWAVDTARSLKRDLNGGAIGAAVGCMMGIALLLLVIKGMMDSGDLVQQAESRKQPIKEAGLWLSGHDPGPKRLMGLGPEITYYAGGTWLPLPYAEPSLTLRYVRHKSPQYLVLTQAGGGERPYLQEWIQKGIPDGRAKVVYDKGSAPKDRVVIYQWESAADGLRD